MRDFMVMNTIWINVQNGVGKHGDFLKSFGAAYTRADMANKGTLAGASRALIVKYDLSKPEYLLEGDSITI